MRHRNTPLCAFCWPTWTVSEMIEENTLLPTCARCVGRNTKPTMPSFLWCELRLAAQLAFGDPAHDPVRTTLYGDPSWGSGECTIPLTWPKP